MKITESSGSNQSSLKFILRSFHYRNYLLFFSGQCISLIGTWMQNIAMSWLVYHLTGSALMLGLVGFVGQVPTFFISPFAGVLADRWNRHRILIFTQTMAMLQAFTLALLVLTKNVSIWHIIPLSVFLGLVNSLDAPARQSFVVEIVENRNDLGNAIALNSSMFNGARLVGPSVAGILISLMGEGWCFLINGVSYFAVIIALLAMRIKPFRIEGKQDNIFKNLVEGFAYVGRHAPIRYILMLLALVSLTCMPYTVLMPIFSSEILRGGPHTLGFLMGTCGMGAFIGAVFLASRQSVRGVEKNIPFAAGLFGISLIFFSQSRSLWFSLLLMLFAGFGMIVHLASCNTVIQTIVDDDKRGRVMSMYAALFMGMAPFGSLFAGTAASRFGAPNTVLVGGIACVIGSFLFAWKLPALRKIILPIYEEKLQSQQGKPDYEQVPVT
ncbi:MAG TPA: MFS transporter [Pelotomaculum sp.]|nr:MFS transporter [Pelotomaculum sp.]